MDGAMVKVSVIGAAELGPELCRSWSNFQEADRTLASPFFRPEFTQVVAAVRNDVRIAILEESGRAIGFFPFQRGRQCVGGPVGGPRSNFQRVIAEVGTRWGAIELVRACGLREWNFDHLLVSQQPFERFDTGRSESVFLDLSGGFAIYARHRCASGSRAIAKLSDQARRLDRDLGPLRFEPHTTDTRVLRTMMRWKSEQYRRTRSTDRFAIEWNVRLLEIIYAELSRAFSGSLAPLYAGDRLAAVNMGLQSHGVVHSWVPAYNRELARCPPGLTLHYATRRPRDHPKSCRSHLGQSYAPYKARMATGVTQLAEGSVTVSSGRAAARAAEGASRRSPLGVARTVRRAHAKVRLVPSRDSQSLSLSRAVAAGGPALGHRGKAILRWSLSCPDARAASLP